MEEDSQKLTVSDQKQLDALGARRLIPDELRAARLRLERATEITPEYEMGRLRVRLENLKALEQMSDCYKAIAQLLIVLHVPKDP